MPEIDNRLVLIYERLLNAIGPQSWWPAEDDFEMVVGAILTQSTAWVNVEKAISNLKRRGLLSPAALEDAPVETVAETIRPSGYFNVKARKLKSFCSHLELHHAGELDSLFHVKLPELREELLGIWGVGAETADSIVLYGARQPIFVVDAYTRRIFARLGLVRPEAGYDEMQGLFAEGLSPSVGLFQEYHALIVALGKDICRPTPICDRCPLLDLCRYGAESLSAQPSAPRSSPASSGRVKRKVVVLPISLSTQILPPWASTSPLAMYSPSPKPGTLLASASRARLNRLKIASRSSCGTPCPQLVTDTITSFSRSPIVSRISVLGKEYFPALESRFTSSCSRRDGSAWRGGMFPRTSTRT